MELTRAELVELRAAQRTHEGAYVRTAIGQFGFALIIVKIFTQEFYAIGALFAGFGAAIMAIGWWRRMESNRMFFDCGEEAVDTGMNRKMFRTCGNVVLSVTALSIAAYVVLIVLLSRLG